MLTIRAGGTWTTSGVTGGTWLHGLGFVGDVNYKTALSGGLLTVSWRMVLPKGFTHPALRNGSLIELHDGECLGIAVMAEPDRDNWTFTADGLALSLKGALALDSSLDPTTDMEVAVTQAASRGLPVAIGTGVPTTALSTMSSDNAEVNSIPALADAHAESLGQHWWFDPHGYLNFGDDPAPGAVDWIITPGTPGLATAEDDYASLVVLRYVATATGSTPDSYAVATASDAAAAARWGVREVVEDGTSLGVLTAPQAATNAQAILESKRARPAFTQGIELAAFQITTPGGTPAHLPHVRAGQRVRQYGVVDPEGMGSTGTAEWIIGGTDYTAGSQVITLSPLGLAPRTLAAVHKGIALRDETFA